MRVGKCVNVRVCDEGMYVRVSMLRGERDV